MHINVNIRELKPVENIVTGILRKVIDGALEGIGELTDTITPFRPPYRFASNYQ